MIFGVCEKLEKNTGINAWLWRILFVVLACNDGHGILIYIILALIL